MTHNLHPKYGNAGYRFPRTTEEAFGKSATISLEEDEEVKGLEAFSFYFGLVVYSLAAVLIAYILMDM